MNKETREEKRKYDTYSVFYNIVEWPMEFFMSRRWRKRIISKLEGNILEVGVGTGKNLRYYTDKAKVTGIDLSSGMLSKAKKEAARLGKDFNLLQMDAQDLKFKAKSFDYVVCTFILCSVPEPAKAIREMSRVCKPNGKIVMLEHVLSNIWTVKLFQRIVSPITKYFFGFSLVRDTPKTIRDVGLKIIYEKNLAVHDMFKEIVCTPKKTK